MLRGPLAFAAWLDQIWWGVNVQAELSGEPSFFLRFDTLEASVDVDAFPPLVVPHGAGFDGLRHQDQLRPGLSDAEGSHGS